MNRSTWIKRAVATFLVVLMNINTFAAVVGDNDGAAFITKAEFESLKNDFQSQINRYNTSLDNKINGAIASYLDGIKVKKETNLKILVPNYNAMRWVAGWDVYGQSKTWTSRTNMTSTAMGWMKPACDRRMLTRGGDIRIFDAYYSAYGGFNTYLRAVFIGFNDGAMQQRNSWVAADGYPQTIPVFAINQAWNVADQKQYVYFNDPYYNSFCLQSAIFNDFHGYTGWAAWQDVGAFWAPTAISINSSSGNQILNYTWTGQYFNNTDNKQTFTSAITTTTSGWPVAYNTGSAYADCGFSSSTTASSVSTDDAVIGNPYSHGVHWYYLNNSYQSQQNTLLRYMMLGKNNEQKANLYQTIYGRNNGGSKLDVSDTEFGTVNCRFEQFGVGNAAANARTLATNSVIGINETGTLKIPKFKWAYVRDLSTNTFRYNDKALSFGSGLPLVNSTTTTTNCDIQVTFNYKINYLLNSTNYTSSKYLIVDLKRDNFLDQSITTTDFFEAYDDIVDTDTTTTSMHRYQQYTYPTRTGEVKMTIPMKQEESLWMRLRPSDESGGYYVTISNLKIKQLTN